MNSAGTPLRIGYIPLVDAAALIVAVDKGFAAAEGLAVDLVREVSWSNVRDKLNIGVFQAAHMLSPVAVASSLGLGHVRVPILAPFNLGLNGNAITVTPRLYRALAEAADGDLADPMVSATALASVVRRRRIRGEEPLNFGMTFPFSNHNYQLRFWMAAGGVDPDEDVRLVVLPPPYMVESLASGLVDGFCVGAPWNSVAVEHGLGHILHFAADFLARTSEKVLAVRAEWAESDPDTTARLIRAVSRSADYAAATENRDEVVAMLAAPHRIAVPKSAVRAALDGHLKVSPDGATRKNPRYLVIGGDAASRPDPVQAAWIYAQMVRWGQAPLTPEFAATARAVYRPDLYDNALGSAACAVGSAGDGIGAFTGPLFDAGNVGAYLSSWSIGRHG